jgi:hypothetical protein
LHRIIYLNPDAARLVREMLGSCGNQSCDEVMAKLGLARVPISLTGFMDRESGSWMKPVFGSLQGYARTEGLYSLGVREVARYFGGKHHIEAMIRKASRSNLGMILGLDAGLVLDVLLPLVDGEYHNGRWQLDMGDFIVANPKEEGVPCYHRGLVVNLPLTPDDVIEILGEQQASEEFAAAIERLKGPIVLPPEYLEALRLNRT